MQLRLKFCKNTTSLSNTTKCLRSKKSANRFQAISIIFISYKYHKKGYFKGLLQLQKPNTSQEPLLLQLPKMPWPYHKIVFYIPTI